MAQIKVLDPKVAALIAAGEVVTRPAAVVKELVENSLDAGARHITVELKEGGRRLIRVVDDGSGMSPEEAPLALVRHATSKIRREEDLLGITTLGFRGEALPSIAQVSRLELLTRAAGAPGGLRIFAEGGKIREVGLAAAPFGTQVTVADLFFNTPVRQKFLKSREAEQAHILETLRHLALGHPEVHFRLEVGKKTLISTPPAASLLERVAGVYGPETAGGLVPFALTNGAWSVTGVLSLPDFTLASSRFQVLLVNKRAVQDRVLAAAIKAAYQGLLPRGRHPLAVALLTLPPEEVDVNIHPAKAEVRFRDPGRVYALLFTALRQGLAALSGKSPGYQVTWQPEALAVAQDHGVEPPSSNQVRGPSPLLPETPVFPLLGGSLRSPTPGFLFQDLVIIGQLQKTYILAEGPAGLIVVDQHAAHERVLYETLKPPHPQESSQALLFPRMVEVTSAQTDWVLKHLELLAQAGLVLEHFGGSTFMVRSVPAWLTQADLTAVVLDVVETLSPVKSQISPQMVQEQVRTLLACHGAIKAGQKLSREEMAELLARLDDLQNPSHCPHGRPLWYLIPFSEIRRSFRRPPG